MALIDDAIAAYETATIALESASPAPSFEQIVAALIARDSVEKKRQMDQAPAGATYAKLIGLDERLKAQAPYIVRDDKLEEWKASVNPTPAQWWWNLSDLEPLLNKAIARYETALNALQTSTEADKSEQVLEVLLARDAVEEARKGQKQLPQTSVAKLVKLDRDLKELSPEIASYDTIAEWKVSLNRQAQYWWWEFKTTAPLPDRALARYQRALKVIEDESRPPVHGELLEALLARDEVEEAISGTFQNQPVPEKFAKQLIDLDRQLKRHRMNLNVNNQLAQWKRSLKRENFWWWNLKPELLGSEEDPPSPRDWVLTGLAIGALGIAASFILSTAQTFSKEVEGVQADAAQNLATVLQVVGLGTAGAGALTKKGQDTIEKMVTVLRLPSNLHAPAALGIAGGLMAVTGIVNASLPVWGGWYISRAKNFEVYNELIKARDSYLQASKFVRSVEAQAEITVGLGKIYERLGRYDKAEQEYEKARLLNDPAAMNALGRILLIQELARQGQLSFTRKTLIDAESLLGRSQTALLPEDSNIEELIESDPEKAAIVLDAGINQVMLEWLKAKWPRQPGITAPLRTPGGFAPTTLGTAPAGSSDPFQFLQDNSDNLYEAHGIARAVVGYANILQEKYGDRNQIGSKISELQTRALCFRDAAAIVLLSLNAQVQLSEEEIGSYNCLTPGARYTVSSEDAFVIETVKESLPVSGEAIGNAYQTLFGS
ncbi:MAG: tetratricopeptide repeat protein [Cyanobacteria bacterium SBLK]|nr:tetratricopeptide repeat protein [Cyanobacteria bacterium SBLK]